MNEIQLAYINALLSDAAYVGLQTSAENQPPSGVLLTDRTVIESRLAANLTAAQAHFLTGNFEILTQTLSPDGGFDAVVWRGKAGGEFPG